VQAQLLNLLKDLQDELGLACIFISHDLAVARFMADEVLVMKDGEVVEQASVAQILEQPQQEYTKRLLGAIPRGYRGGGISLRLSFQGVRPIHHRLNVGGPRRKPPRAPGSVHRADARFDGSRSPGPAAATLGRGAPPGQPRRLPGLPAVLRQRFQPIPPPFPGKEASRPLPSAVPATSFAGTAHGQRQTANLRVKAEPSGGLDPGLTASSVTRSQAAEEHERPLRD
jgi:hypothetical protein